MSREPCQVNLKNYRDKEPQQGHGMAALRAASDFDHPLHSSGFADVRSELQMDGTLRDRREGTRESGENVGVFANGAAKWRMLFVQIHGRAPRKRHDNVAPTARRSPRATSRVGGKGREARGSKDADSPTSPRLRSETRCGLLRGRIEVYLVCRIQSAEGAADVLNSTSEFAVKLH